MSSSRVGRRYRKYLWDSFENVVPRQTAARRQEVKYMHLNGRFKQKSQVLSGPDYI